MNNWHSSDESDMPLWVLDLDNALYSVAHRRLCVWFDELEAVWRWEIQTYEHQGVASAGTGGSELEAKTRAEVAAQKLSDHPADGGAP